MVCFSIFYGEVWRYIQMDKCIKCGEYKAVFTDGTCIFCAWVIAIKEVEAEDLIPK